jgi:hypothetical protein
MAVSSSWQNSNGMWKFKSPEAQVLNHDEAFKFSRFYVHKTNLVYVTNHKTEIKE